MGAFDHLVEVVEPTLDDRIFVEKKDAGTEPEIKRQSVFVNQMRRYAPRCIVAAVPNSAEAGRTKLRQMREGAAYGCVDLFVTWTGAVAFIEFKAGKTMPRTNQIEFMNRLAAQDHPVAVCRTAKGAMEWLRGIGAPVPETRA